MAASNSARIIIEAVSSSKLKVINVMYGEFLLAQLVFDFSAMNNSWSVFEMNITVFKKA